MIIKRIFTPQRDPYFDGWSATTEPADRWTVLVGFSDASIPMIGAAGDDIRFHQAHESLADISELNALHENVDLILTPLIARKFDALDMACKLSDLGYVGRYKAVARKLPDCAMVIREIQALNPQLDFDIVQLAVL